MPTNLDCGTNLSTFVADLACSSRLHLTDTFRFFQSPPFPTESVESGGGFSDDAASFEKDRTFAEPTTFTVLRLLHGALGTSCLWMFCVVLDFVLLAYRASHIYLSVRRIRSILSYDRRGLYRPYKNIHHGNGQLPPGDDLARPFRDDVPSSRQHQDDVTTRAAADFMPTFADVKVCDDADCLNDRARGSLRTTVMVCLTSKMLPKVLVAAMLVVVFCTFNDKYWNVFYPEMLKSAGVLSMYILPISNEINLTHAFVLGQLSHYHNVTMTLYQNQLLLDLLNLQSLLLYFNLGM